MVLNLVYYLDAIQITTARDGSANLALSSTTIVGIIFELFTNLNVSHILNINKYSFIQKTWIIDTGAYDHMCHDITCFSSIHALSKPFQITLPIGSEILVSYIGIDALAKNFCISQILLVPDFHFNLLSVTKLIHQLHCRVVFSSKFCILQCSY